MSRKMMYVLAVLGCLGLVSSVATAELVGYWPMNEGQGAVTSDVSGNGHDGTIVGTPVWTDGPVGLLSALEFGSGSTGVNCGRWNPTTINNPDGTDVSFTLWLKRGAAGGYQGIISNRDTWGSDDTTINWALELNPGSNMQFGSRTQSTYGRGVVPEGEWVFIAGTFDGATFTVYQNAGEPSSGGARYGQDKNSPVRIGAAEQGGGNLVGVIDQVKLYDHILTLAEIRADMAIEPYPKAAGPTPGNGATDVRLMPTLSWMPGAGAVTHDVYFGASFDDVNTATAASDVLLSGGQSGTSAAVTTKLALETVYYWRVDETDGDGVVHQGPVWSFTTEPVAYPLEPIAATATTTSDEGKGPENLIDGSGLTDGAHSIADTDMWNGLADGNAVAVEFEFDSVHKLYDLQVWNYNTDFDIFTGFGVKDVTIEYSVDANEWVTLGDFELARGTGSADYTGMTIDLEGVVAKYVKFNINSNWGGTGNYGLSEVLFSYIPVVAREPEPEDGATDVGLDTVLSWRAGREAASHLLYLDTDSNAVADETAVPIITTAAAYDPPALELTTTYFWKVVEVNDAETPAEWATDVWSFSMPEYVVVDDMESYDDEDNRIYYSWIDGLDDSTNGGSQVAPDDPPYTEQDIVRSGDQAMQLQFGLSGKAFSEVDLAVGGENWTAGGGSVLVLYFYGDMDNVPGQLYVKINGTRLNYTGSPENLTRSRWNQAVFSLAGVAASNVTSLTIGIDGAGNQGTLLIDDLRVYRTAPADPVAAPVDPGTAGLMAYYKMENNYSDSSGSGITGTAVGAPTFAAGLGAFGTAVSVAGADCVDLGVRDVFNPAGSFTVALWAKATAWDSDWGCAMMGNRGESGIGWQVRRYASTPSICFTTRGVGSDDTRSNGAMPVNEWAQITCVYDNDANIKRIYVNGALDIEVTTDADAALAATTHNTYIGARANSDNSAPEAFFTGLLDEVKFFNRALSAGEAEFLSDPTP